MSRFHSHIASATTIITTFREGEPLVHFLRKFFAANKKYGSRDRKTIAGLCYHYFRAASALKEMPLEERILQSVFLCETNSSPILAFFHPELDARIGLSAEEKCAIIEVSQENLFPYAKDLSAGIDADRFALSFLTQPDLFLRIRPGKRQVVTGKLVAAGIAFDPKDEHCLVLKNTTSLDGILKLNREAVVQDLSSQQVFESDIITQFMTGSGKIKVWDCCAASGGKSMLLYDAFAGNVFLTVSDIRENILANLRSRFQQAGIPIDRWFIEDLAKPSLPENEALFDVIICDAPCTGSGTWSRTPEQLASFQVKKIKEYSVKQKAIAVNASAQLKVGGLFVYITCSVFREENELLASYLQDNFNLKLLESRLIKGYNDKADTMYVAVFQK